MRLRYSDGKVWTFIRLSWGVISRGIIAITKGSQDGPSGGCMIIAVNAVSATVGGGVTYLANLLPAMGLIGPEHQIVVFLRRGVDQRLRRQASSHSIKVVEVDVRGLAQRLVFEQCTLLRHIREMRADVVFGAAEIVPLGARCRAVMACQNANLYDCSRRRMAWPVRQRARLGALRLLARRSARKCERVISLSEAWREPIAQRLGIHRDRVAVIPHGVSDDFRFVGREKLRACRSDVGTTWLSVASIYRHKNLDRLVCAIDAARRVTTLDLQLRIVGRAASTDHMLSSSKHRSGVCNLTGLFKCAGR